MCEETSTASSSEDEVSELVRMLDGLASSELALPSSVALPIRQGPGAAEAITYSACHWVSVHTPGRNCTAGTTSPRSGTASAAGAAVLCEEVSSAASASAAGGGVASAAARVGETMRGTLPTIGEMRVERRLGEGSCAAVPASAS